MKLAAPLRVMSNSIRMLPEFIIIGAMKCGTTSLYRQLIQHPQIASARRKEVHYFDWYFDKGEAWYRGQFPVASWASRSIESDQRLITGEASPYYLFHPQAPRRVHEMLPEVKLIVLLRNPVDRAWSHFHHVVDRNGETLSFEEALKAESKRLAGEREKLEKDPVYRSFEYQKHSYQSRGIYVDGLEAWMRYFDPSRFLILRSEDFFADPPRVFDQTLRFLGLRSYELPSYERFLAGSYTTSMDPDTRKELIELFRPHNLRLSKLVGKDLDWDR